MRKTKFENGRSSIVKRIIIGCFVICAVFVIEALAASAVLYNLTDPTANIKLISMALFVLSGGIGSFINSKLFCGEKPAAAS